MSGKVYEVRALVPARSARHALDELCGRTIQWWDDVAVSVSLASASEPGEAVYDPADHPEVVEVRP